MTDPQFRDLVTKHGVVGILDMLAASCDREASKLDDQNPEQKPLKALLWGSQVHTYHAARMIEMLAAQLEPR